MSSIPNRPTHEMRICPLCGKATHWPWHPVFHRVNGDHYVHVKIATSSGSDSRHPLVLASILKNGKAVEE